MEEGFIQGFINKIMDGVRTSLLEISQAFDMEKGTTDGIDTQAGCSDVGVFAQHV